MRLLREAARLLLAFSLLTSVAPASAQSAWVLWRHFVPTDNPEANDARLWQPEPKTTREQCDSEVKQYQALDPDKLRVDSTGRTYRIEYRCLPDTVEPRGSKSK
jgi:hypothetical protein